MESWSCRILTEKVRRSDRRDRRRREISEVAGDDKCRTGCFSYACDRGILEIVHRKLSCSLPSGSIEVSDLKMAQNMIHRYFRISLHGVFSDEIVECRQAMCRADANEVFGGNETHNLCGGSEVRLMLLKNVQQHIDVHGDRHECFFSR